MLKVTGYDDCAMGVVFGCGRENTIIYNVDKIIKKMMKRDGMTYDDAFEYFNFNIAGAYMGTDTPVFLHKKSSRQALNSFINECYPDEIEDTEEQEPSEDVSK